MLDPAARMVLQPAHLDDGPCCQDGAWVARVMTKGGAQVVKRLLIVIGPGGSGGPGGGGRGAVSTGGVPVDYAQCSRKSEAGSSRQRHAVAGAIADKRQAGSST